MDNDRKVVCWSSPEPVGRYQCESERESESESESEEVRLIENQRLGENTGASITMFNMPYGMPVVRFDKVTGYSNHSVYSNQGVLR